MTLGRWHSAVVVCTPVRSLVPQGANDREGGPAIKRESAAPSVAELLVDLVHERLAALEAAQVLLEDPPDVAHGQRRPGRVVRRDDAVRGLPERIGRGQWLLVRYVEAGPGEVARLE